MATLGYARVSTTQQDLEGQLVELNAFGCERIFCEKQSGASTTERGELHKLLATVASGDIVVVTRLDRLARSTRDLLNVLDQLNKRGVHFKSLRDSWADTTTAHGRLMLTILGGLAEFERELIRSRTGEGRKRAKERGVKFGRPFKLSEAEQREVLTRLNNGESQPQVAQAYNVTAATICRLNQKAQLGMR